MAILIQNAADGLPVFFSLADAVSMGVGQAWTEDRDRALQFAREQDALAFIRRYFPNMPHLTTVKT